MTSTLPLTLIVATTPSMGIGLGGRLPWPAIRSEMAYFTRVTRLAPPGYVNAVVMGRKTWDSIPQRFRPLKGRVNVILSRRPEAMEIYQAPPSPSSETCTPPEASILAACGLQEAIAKLSQLHKDCHGLHRVFVIGGAEVYRTALELHGVTTILRTKVTSEFACDTYFPLSLGHDKSWVKRGQAELNHWAGEEVPAGLQRESSIEWEFELWEKIS
ncbi:MAG: dihydrofolate reductase [Stictis urceolatum]|nr:dihydrofolate reductase [Stictis urceolata]